MFCDISKIGSLLKAAEKSDEFKTIVTFDTLTDEEIISKCKARGITVMTMDEILVFISATFPLRNIVISSKCFK